MVVPVVVAAAAALVTQVGIGDSGDVLVPVALAAAAGLVVGLIAAWVAERRSSTILGPGDLGKLTSVPNLAVVPRHAIGASRPDDVAMFRDPNSIEAEGYRTLRTALEFVTRTSADGDSDGPGPIVLITSPRPGEGKSSVAANLAAATAMAGRRVVLVDGDLRKPQVHRLFRVKNGVGLSSVLRGDATLAEAVQRLDVVDGFALLSAGPPPPDPAEQLANERLELTLHALAQAADLVLVDAPPLLAVTDPTMIVQHCDAVLMVATAGFSSRREWAEAMPRLDVVSANVVGTVLLQPDDRVQATPAYRYAPSAAPSNWWVTQSRDAVERPDTDDADGDAEVAADTGETAAAERAWDDDPTTPDERPESHAWVVDVPTDVTSIDKPSEPDDPTITDDWPTRRTDG